MINRNLKFCLLVLFLVIFFQVSIVNAQTENLFVNSFASNMIPSFLGFYISSFSNINGHRI